MCNLITTTIMKKLIFVLFCLCIVITSCSKETITTDSDLQEKSQDYDNFRIPTNPTGFGHLAILEPCVARQPFVQIYSYTNIPCTVTRSFWIDINEFTILTKQSELYVDISYIDPGSGLPVNVTHNIIEIIDNTLNNPLCDCPALVGLHFTGPNYPTFFTYRFRAVHATSGCQSQSPYYLFQIPSC